MKTVQIFLILFGLILVMIFIYPSSYDNRPIENILNSKLESLKNELDHDKYRFSAEQLLAYDVKTSGNKLEVTLFVPYLAINKILPNVVGFYWEIHKLYPEVNNFSIRIDAIDPPREAMYYCKGEWFVNATYINNKINMESIEAIIHNVEATRRINYVDFDTQYNKMHDYL